MRRSTHSRARTSRVRGLRRRGLALAGAVSLSVGALVGATGSPGVAAPTDPCVQPQVSEVMVNQGVASYQQLARGKTTLVKYFLRLPGCAPVGTTIQVTGGKLFVSSGSQIPLLAALPLPPIGLAATSPIPSAASDPLFVVEGKDVVPDASGRIAFIAELEYTATVPDTEPVTGAIQVSRLPGTSTPVSAQLAPELTPLRVLVVPMGDQGTRQQNTYRSQFPVEAEEGVLRGMVALSRQFPVPDAVGSLSDRNPGLRYSINGSLLHLGEHLENGITRNYMPDGVFCGNDINSIYVGAKLQDFRTAWNSMNPSAQADFALGQVWQAISRGKSTDPGANCADGYAHLNAKQSWGRVVTATPQRPDVTGAITAMELVHNLGQVPPADPRFLAGFHSRNTEADVTAPDRAWNILERTWLALDRSALKYDFVGWHGSNTLLEREDWGRTQCVLVNGGDAASACGIFGGIGTSAAGGSSDAGSFFISGRTDGTAAGTEAHTYRTDGSTYDDPVESSEFRFVQRDASGFVVSNTGMAVGTSADNHHSEEPNGPATHLKDGVFGTQFPADIRTASIEIWKGSPGTAGAVRLFHRTQNAVPSLVSLSLGGRTVTVSATDDSPENLRLDLFLACPGQTSPLEVGLRPEAVVGSAAAFVAAYDTSLGCAQGRVVARVTDGMGTAVQEEPVPTVQDAAGTAAIYAPTGGAVIRQFETLSLSGTGRDALDQPAARLVWSLQGPSYPVPTVVAEGANPQVARQDGFAPGGYTVTLEALGPGDLLLARASSTLDVLADSDRDRIADAEDRFCDGSSAALDPRNAVSDSDGDGDADVVDDAPCQSSSTLDVRFRPDSLRTSSSGVPVTLTISSRAGDLGQLQAGDLFVTQIAGFPTKIPVLSFRATDARSGELKVDRDALTLFLRGKDLVGYTPVFVGTLDGRLKGADRDYPLVFP